LLKKTHNSNISKNYYIGQKRGKEMLYMSEQDYADYMKRFNQQIEPAETTTKKNKYRNLRVYIYEDGFISHQKEINHGKLKEKFDSVKEYERASELRLLERAKIISNLETQKTLIIKEGFITQDKKKVRAITYKADFFYQNADGDWIVEDVKGFNKKTNKYQTTETFNLKWKLLQARYPDYIFQIY
jgi:hypothetical protein